MKESYDDRKMRILSERILELEFAVQELMRFIAASTLGCYSPVSELLRYGLDLDEDEN